MTKTVTCLYQDQDKAAAIVSRLEQADIPRSDIYVYTDVSDNLIDDLDDAGVPRSDTDAYAEGVRRGGSLVAVECHEDEVDRVIDILDGEGLLDLDEQQTTWRSEGWQGYDACSSVGTSGLGSAAPETTSGLAESSDMTDASMAGRLPCRQDRRVGSRPGSYR